MPDIHYLWMGPPPPTIYAGHDHIGPNMMRDSYPDIPIHFWCFADQVAHYTQLFEGRGIDIHPIEPFIAEYDPACYAFIHELKSAAISHPAQRDIAREYTTIKALSQYFLQIFFEGYFLDTNIIPDPDCDARPLKSFNRFSYPYWPREIYCNLIKRHDYLDDVDPWMMYSPKKDRKAIQRFNEYFLLAKKEFDERGDIDSDHIDRGALGEAFVSSARYSGGRALAVQSSNGGSVLQVAGLKKRYYNTHKKEGYMSGPLLHELLITEGAESEVSYLIQHTEFDPREKYEAFDEDEKEHKETNLILTSIEYADYDALRLLLHKTKDITLEDCVHFLQESQTRWQTDTTIERQHCFFVLLTFYVDSFFSNDWMQFLTTLLSIDGILTQSSNPIEAAKEVSATYLSQDEVSLNTILVNMLFSSPSFETALNLVTSLGSLTSDSKNTYLDSLLKHFALHQAYNDFSFFNTAQSRSDTTAMQLQALLSFSLQDRMDSTP